MEEKMAAEYEKTQEIVEQFRELSPVWLSRFPYNSGSALENKKRELKRGDGDSFKTKSGSTRSNQSIRRIISSHAWDVIL